MRTDGNCVIGVGHLPTIAVWRDARNPTFMVCDRHRRQYDERTDDLGPFDWVCMVCRANVNLADLMTDDGNPSEAARHHLAWLMWCWQEGYTNASDRAILTNWLLEPESLNDEDANDRIQLLKMADEVLAEMSKSMSGTSFGLHAADEVTS